MTRRAIFDNKLLPYALLAPQLAITIVFFFWPAGQAIVQSLLRQDPFGLRTTFVWFENFAHVLGNPTYLNALGITLVFSATVILVAMASGLLLAVTADKGIRGAGIYKTLLIWPYAVAPAVAASLWLFIFHPS
ncbi:MAG: carbohydrate ABC transporter permease, partial [bacterium]